MTTVVGGVSRSGVSVILVVVDCSVTRASSSLVTATVGVDRLTVVVASVAGVSFTPSESTQQEDVGKPLSHSKEAVKL